MRKMFFAVIVVWLFIALSFIACKKTAISSLPPQPLLSTALNKTPVADAGPDQIIVLPSNNCVLLGKGTDQDGDIVNYAWSITVYYSQIGEYDSFRYSSQNVALKNLQQGWYWATLVVTDDGGLTAKDHVVIKVVAPGCPCYPDPCDAFGDPCDPWDY